MTALYTLDVAPDWSGKVLERLEWTTDILRKRNGTEQRFSMRGLPRQTIEYDFLVYRQHMQSLKMKLQGDQGGEWIVPVWFNMQKSDADISVGATTLNFETIKYEWHEAEYLILYSDQTHYEVVEILSVLNGTVVLNAPVAKNWPTGTWIVPAKIGHVREKISMQAVTGDVFRGRVQVNFDSLTTHPLTALNTLESRWFLDSEPNWVTPRKTTWERDMELIDYGLGPTLAYDKTGFSEVTRDYEYLMSNRDRLYLMRSAIHSVKGRWKGFYIPTYNSDLTIKSPVSSTDTSIEIEFTHFNDHVLDRFGFVYLQIRLKNGVQVLAKVINATSSPGVSEVLVLSAQVGETFNPQDVLRVSFVFINRLDSDAVEFNWITPNAATTLLPLRSVLQ